MLLLCLFVYNYRKPVFNIVPGCQWGRGVEASLARLGPIAYTKFVEFFDYCDGRAGRRLRGGKSDDVTKSRDGETANDGDGRAAS